jgi:hypothetical protein
MKKPGYYLIALLGLLQFGLASAATLDFDPTSKTVNINEIFAVDVVVSDLGNEIVSAYDLDVNYNSSFLTATGVVFNPVLGDEFFFEAFYGADTSTAGVVDFAGLSLLSDAGLAAIQLGDSVVIATLSFLAIGIGDSNLSFGLAPPGDDVKGLNAGRLPIGSLGEASISVVPIPGAALLMLTGLLGIGFASRKRNNEA